MSKSVISGELRTPIRVVLPQKTVVNGYEKQTMVNVFGDGNVAWCKWVNSHGKDVYENQRLALGQVATLTMRYSPLVTQKCILWRDGETGTPAVPTLNAWEIVSIDDVEQRHQYLEITVKRKVVA